MDHDKLVSITQKVIRNTAGAGLDVAGTMVCGPFWPIFKKAMQPVFEELEKKYPHMFGCIEDSEKAAEALSADVKLVEILHSSFDVQFQELKEGQNDIIACLMQQSVILQKISDIGEQVEKTSIEGFKKLPVQIEEVLERALRQYPPQRLLTLPEIKEEARNLQEDANRWIHIHLPTAQRRLDEARSVIADGLKLSSKDARLIILQGFIELTQSNVSRKVGNPQAATAALDAAAENFAALLKVNPSNAAAINGIAYIYLRTKQYDSAINYSRIAIQQMPNYSNPYWTLTYALEGKMKQFGQDLSLLLELMENYEKLEYLLSTDRRCSASEYNYVTKRRKEIKDALRERMKDALGELYLDIWGLPAYYFNQA